MPGKWGGMRRARPPRSANANLNMAYEKPTWKYYNFLNVTLDYLISCVLRKLPVNIEPFLLANHVVNGHFIYQPLMLKITWLHSTQT